ncbi:ParB/RepB/Spo0J family partition protein [Herbaspirillum sp. 1130]|uniref:ParB/RepB/Spo0J family partition protein n=1 Tax=Herbaspirillum sp. 1130 TaxID=2806562 RepID=UPI001AE48549|nr:ParB/RepB/Spo0J family partition protein [Herbaspirillum sp. 1130]MBP1316328.1 ParB/RepB/Spo0J family partition protein [Herbaspirillum sp. 1130]
MEVIDHTQPAAPFDWEKVTEPLFGNIPITSIVTADYQPRQTFNDDTLQELAESIKEHGINQPILFRQAKDRPDMLELVSGERRLRAAIIAGLDHVPGMVKRMTDEEAAAFRLVENMQRENVAPLEEAQGIKRLMDEFHFSVDDIIKKLGKKRGVIYGSLKLLNLSATAQSLVVESKVPASTALLVARIPVPALQEKAMAEIVSNGGANEPMSFRAAKQHIEDRYMLDLSEADFSLKDAKLIKACGACSECPKRTINSPEDFPGVTADLCTDPDCFEAKEAAHHKAVVATALKRKIPVFACRVDANNDFPGTDFVSGEHARMHQFERLVSYSSNLLSQSGLQKSDYPTPAAYYMEDEKAFPLYAKKAIQAALEKAGLARTEVEEEEFERQEEQQRVELAKEKQATEKEDPAAVLRKRVVDINWKIAKAYNAFHEELLEEIKDLVDQQTLLPIYRTLAVFSAGQAARSEQLSFSQKVDESYNVDFMDAAAVEELVEHASDEDICRLHLDAVLSNIPSVYGGAIDGGLIKFEDEWEEWNYQHYQILIKLGNICGIDIDLARDKHLAEPLQELAEAMTPAKEEPAEEHADTPKPKATKKQPARPKKAASAPEADPAAAWPFPKSKEGL